MLVERGSDGNQNSYGEENNLKKGQKFFLYIRWYIGTDLSPPSSWSVVHGSAL